MAVRKRRGFTLVEMLVVISIIGMLAALLLPAIQGARESGRRAVCINNQHQLSLAITRYEQAKNELPGYLNVQATRSYGITGGVLSGAAITKVYQPCTWVFPLLPFLDRNDIFNAYGGQAADEGASGTSRRGVRVDLQLAILTCPSDARANSVANPPGAAEPGNHAPLSYVVNCGMPDIFRSLNVNYTGTPILATASGPAGSLTVPTTGAVARDAASNGVFHDRYPDYYASSGGKVPEVSMSFAFVSASDGMSTTLLFSENADCGNWNLCDWGSGTTPATSSNRIEEEVGFVWWPNVDTASTYPNVVLKPPVIGTRDVCGINQSTGLVDGDAGSEILYARPSSFHPGVVVATFCDGHTTTLNSGIDYLVYTLLMTPQAAGVRIVNQSGVAPASGTNSFITVPTAAQMQVFTKTLLDEKSY